MESGEWRVGYGEWRVESGVWSVGCGVMTAYFIANIRIRDEKGYQKYLDDVDLVFGQFNGRYLAVDDRPEVLEGIWDYSRLVLIEFPDKESLRSWYDSAEYQNILKYRLGAAECDSIIIER